MDEDPNGASMLVPPCAEFPPRASLCCADIVAKSVGRAPFFKYVSSHFSPPAIEPLIHAVKHRRPNLEGIHVPGVGQQRKTWRGVRLAASGKWQ